MATQAQAVLISPVSGAILQGDTSRFPSSINDVGFVIDGVINFDQFLSFRTHISAPDGIVRFDLGDTYDLSSLRFWNNAGSNGFDTEGVSAFSLALLTPVLTEISTTAFNPKDGLAAQDFGLTGTGVRFIDMTVTAGHMGQNQFGTYTAFYEIQFDAELTAVPTPSTLALLGFGLLGLGVRRRAC